MSLIQKLRERLSPRGREIPDPTPMAPPVGFRPAPSLSDQIREMVRSERLAREVAESGHESFEEADDFDVGDDYEPNTPFEEHFDPQGRSSFEPLAEVNKQEAAKNKEAKEKQEAAKPPQPPQPAAKPPAEPGQGDMKPPADKPGV